MAPVVLAVRLRVVHPAAKSLLADLVERPVVLLAVLVVLLRVLHLAALGVPEVPVVHPVVLVVLVVPVALAVLVVPRPWGPQNPALPRN